MTTLRFPWDSEQPPGKTVPVLPGAEPPAKRRGRRPKASVPPSAGPWLYHHLTVSGPAAEVAAFAEAARGAGVIPWELDMAAIEEWVFTLAVSPPPHRRSLTVAGCRILAQQFRERVEARQGRARQAWAAARAGGSRTCPFDLHTLLPVPDALLPLGPDHPRALAWLRQHWGTTDGLRQVAERPNPSAGRRLPAHHSTIGYGFFTAGDRPAAAIRQLETRWPGLRIMLKPRPAQ